MTQQASARWHACFSPLMLGLPSLQCCRNHFPSVLLCAVGVGGPPRGFVLIFEAFESGSSLRVVWISVN